MRVNADFAERAIVHDARSSWIASPMPGVERKMLDRIGGEVARATSIVRYAPGSNFSEHTHSGGEEFIVLDGVFQDEHANYPAGSYVRNPIGTHHVPRSDAGCTIFVKLWQFDAADQKQSSIDLNALKPRMGDDGIASVTLHEFGSEVVTYEVLARQSDSELSDEGGLELLVLEGEVSVDGELLAENDWLRLPPGEVAQVNAGRETARLWIKRGHLREFKLPPQV